MNSSRDSGTNLISTMAYALPLSDPKGHRGSRICPRWRSSRCRPGSRRPPPIRDSEELDGAPRGGAIELAGSDRTGSGRVRHDAGLGDRRQQIGDAAEDVFRSDESANVSSLPRPFCRNSTAVDGRTRGAS